MFSIIRRFLREKMLRCLQGQDALYTIKVSAVGRAVMG
jgi:hypothetical protein